MGTCKNLLNCIKQLIQFLTLANVNDTKRSAVDQLYTAFRSVVEGERALISFGHGIGKHFISFGCATTASQGRKAPNEGFALVGFALLPADSRDGPID